MPKILVLGDSGKLGRALVQAFSADWDIQRFSRSSGHNAEDFESLKTCLRNSKPDLVANAAALTGVLSCESEPSRAFLLNALLPLELAKASNGMGFRLIHFSTDAVFDRSQPHPAVKEDDIPNPGSIYSTSKLAGENLVLARAKEAWVFRLSVLFGESGIRPQFVERMLGRLVAGDTGIRIASDQYCSPSYSRDIALAIRAHITGGLPPGLYHLANTGGASLFELLNRAATFLGTPVLPHPASRLDFPSPVPSKGGTILESKFIPGLRPWEEALAEWCIRQREGDPGYAENGSP